MRVMIAKDPYVGADHICRSVREVKKVLNEEYVNSLSISYQVPGSETGLSVLQWAAIKRRLPREILLLEKNRVACKTMGEFLTKQGYRAVSERQYVYF